MRRRSSSRDAAHARIERVVGDHFLQAIDGLIQFVTVITSAVEARFEIEQLAASFIEPLLIASGGIAVAAGPIEIRAYMVEETAVADGLRICPNRAGEQEDCRKKFPHARRDGRSLTRLLRLIEN